MAFKDLFKRKPGGTFVGNLVRGAAHGLTGGLLGNGAMKITPEEYAAKQQAAAAGQPDPVPFIDSNAGQNVKKIAGGAALGITLGNSDIKAAGGGSDGLGDQIQGSAMTLLKKYAGFIIGGVVAIGTLIYFIARPKPKKYGRR